MSMTYDGPLFFEAHGASLVPMPFPCSPLCRSCPSAHASSSRTKRSVRVPVRSTYDCAAMNDGDRCSDLRWARVESDTHNHRLSLSDPPCGHAAVADVHGPSLSNACSRPVSGLAYDQPDDACTNDTEMTPAFDSDQTLSSQGPFGTPRSLMASRSERFGAESSQASLGADYDLQPSSESALRLTLYKRQEAHVYESQSTIWDWVAGVERRRQPSPLPYSSAPLPESLPVPYDVDLEVVIASTSVTAHASSPTTMPMPSSPSSIPLQGPRLGALALHSSSQSDRSVNGQVRDWQRLSNDASLHSQSHLTSSSRSSAPSSHLSALPMESTFLDESVRRSLLGQWADTKGWREGELEGEGPVLGSSRAYENTYPRSAGSSSPLSETDFQPAELLSILDHQEISPRVLQNFTIALTDASLKEDDADQGRDQGDDADSGTMSVSLSGPDYLRELEFMDQWSGSPPALRSSSSTSSLDPFHLELELFSPASETGNPDAASVWDDMQCSPEDSSLSSSPFVGWSSSDSDAKPALLSMGHVPSVPFAAIPLHQPQPVRPIPPIPIHLLDDSPPD
ncbi:hypothetical protein DFH11DRAFT_7814 [Phellopilus nigrolimitatus]|nr:hypothetical protein DFH11DRAFT_7814 [Phellopilus nigrolimitatus]